MELPRDDSAPATDLKVRVDTFRASIAPDVYRPANFVPWTSIDREVDRLGGAVLRLQGLVDTETLDSENLAAQLAFEPQVLEVIKSLFVAPTGAGFSDGRELPDVIPPGPKWQLPTASLALDLGLLRILPSGSRVEDLLRLALVANDARRRGFRRRDDLDDRLQAVLADAISEAGARIGASVQALAPSRFPVPLRGRVRDVIASDGQPYVAVATVFQAQSGGRQQRDLAVTYPRLQEELDALPMALVLIADGRGFLETPRRILDVLMESTAACITIGQAESGALADAIESAIRGAGVRQTRRASALALIERALEIRPQVSAGELPVARDAALLAMGQFVAEHPDLALDIDQGATAIRWRNQEMVARAQDLPPDSDPGLVARVVAETLGLEDVAELAAGPDVAMLSGTMAPDRVLPRTLVVAATARPVDEDIVRDVARRAKAASAEASLAALVSGRVAFWRGQPRTAAVQQSMATSVVVVDTSQLVRIAGAANPRDAFVQLVLEQADLTKANPFTSMGATRREMFFGRTVEAADLRATLRTNSVALIGGRRIGKTSLMQRLVDELRQDEWQPHYADLQEAGDWKTFASLISLRWGLDVPLEFAPSHLGRIASALKDRGSGRLVILLDEIDHLLRWDLQHDDGNVPEAFFRACRSLSQQGVAQFVFSGERLVSERLWDPSSPHWNFCKPIPVKQLSKEAAGSLLSEPFGDLGVALRTEDEVLDLVWSRTQGHPQLIQFVGERAVTRLNSLPADLRSLLPVDLVVEIVDSDEFRQQYCETYWGQATDEERLISALIASGVTRGSELKKRLRSLGTKTTERRVSTALRMLDLYGVIEEPFDPLRLRASWLPDAMSVYGGADALVAEYEARAQT
jgi:hypothetical protein